MASKQRPTVVAQARGKRSRARAGGGQWDFIRSVLGALAVFLFIKIFLIEAYRIPSGSMIPTLLIGDFLFVNKLAFGPHVPFTDARLPGYTDPHRGQVVVYQSPDSTDGNPIVVKRIVGVAGDTLYMRHGLLYVNGLAQRQGYGALADPEQPEETDPGFAWQKRFVIRNSRFGPPPAEPSHDDWGPFVVPAQHLFSLGDNRYNSKDARYYGFVPRDNVRGTPLFVYYSYDAEHSSSPVPWITDIRWSRIGHVIR